MPPDDITTGVDRLVRLVHVAGSISVKKAARRLRVPESMVEEWGIFLEEEGVVQMKYRLANVYIIKNELTAQRAMAAEELESEQGATRSVSRPSGTSARRKRTVRRNARRARRSVRRTRHARRPARRARHAVHRTRHRARRPVRHVRRAPRKHRAARKPHARRAVHHAARKRHVRHHKPARHSRPHRRLPKLSALERLRRSVFGAPKHKKR